MDTICLNDIKTLIQNGGGAHISIFMPAHHKGGVDQQDPIRLKNLLRIAEEKLVAKGLRSAEARSLLKPAETLLTDNLFWRQQSDGLALFIATNQYFYYRLPVALKEMVRVGERYCVSPIVPVLSNCGLFYILAISQNENRLLQCTPSGSIRINLSDVPEDMSEALRYETPDNRLQYHVTVPSGGSNFGGATAIQTGEGSSPNYEKRNMLQYFEQVDKGVAKYLKGETAPMVLAAVDYLHSLYRSANTYRNLLPEGIMGNQDIVSDEILREQARTIVQPYFDQARRDAVADFHKSAGTGLTATGLADVVISAFQGRVRFLFIEDVSQHWGTFDAENRQVIEHSEAKPGDDDLVDFASYQTLKHAGSIHVMKPEEVPGNAPLSAILRF